MDILINIIVGVFSNKILIVSLTGWVVAQMLKVYYYYFKTRKINFGHMLESGGFPSTHSALVISVATACGLYYGFDSPFFAVAIAFALIVTYDATGVRRAAGQQAFVLNKLIKEKYEEEPRLKELLGHSPLEVFGGILVGIIVPFIYYLIGY